MMLFSSLLHFNALRTLAGKPFSKNVFLNILLVITTEREVRMNRNKMVKAVPTSMSKNLLFVVDLTAPHVKGVKALFSDDLEAWDPTGTRTKNHAIKQLRQQTALTVKKEFTVVPGHINGSHASC